MSLYPELAQAVAHLAGAVRAPGVRARREAGRVLIHVNNFENLARADTACAAALVRDLRDYFLIPHSHWVFVGAANLEADVFRASEAVSGIVPLVADLPPLAPEEVTALLERRYERLRVGLHFVPPVAPEAAEALYRRYDGDLRNFLRLLSNAVQRTSIAGRPASLTAPAVGQTMADPYRRILARQLGAVDLAYLASGAEGGTPGLRVRAADLAARTGLAKGSVTELVARLESKGALRYDATEGRNTDYRLRPDAEIAVGLA